MKSKKGVLAIDEIVNLAIGVIGFIAILFLLFSLSKMVTNTIKEEQARNALDDIVFQLKNIQSGVSKQITIEGPKDWMLIQYPSSNKICICPSSLLSKITNQGDLNSNVLYTLCAESSNVCADIKGVSVFGNTQTAIKDSKTMLSSVCFTGATPTTGKAPIPGCILFFRIPLNILVSNVSGVLGVYPVDEISFAKIETLDSIVDIVNNLKDGDQTIVDIGSFVRQVTRADSPKNTFSVAANRLWVCDNYLNSGFSESVLQTCRNGGNSRDVNAGLNLTIDNGKVFYLADKDAKGSIYYLVMEKSPQYISVKKSENNISISAIE